MQRFGKPVGASGIRRIQVFLVKHGEFYHPARIELDLGLLQPSFVLNVAVSEAGRACLEEECRSLNRLAGHTGAGYIPRAYVKGMVSAPNHPDLKMWLGEWLDGFHEFHWSRNEADDGLLLAVWDPQAGKRYLNAQQIGAVYSGAAAILTHFFDLTSFEQIHPWHHGAGDFVVRQQGDVIDVRLVTVRGYASLLSAPPQSSGAQPDAALTLQMLLLFLVRLSLRMRLDRLDGVGELLWADKTVVTHTVDGFLTALAQKPPPPQLPDSPLRCFAYFFSRCSETDLQEITAAVVAAYRPGHPEKNLLQRTFQAHAAELFAALEVGLVL